MAALVIGREVGDIGSFVVAAIAGAAIIPLGFAAASRSRPLPAHASSQRARLTVFSVLAGSALGLANLAANWTIARTDPAIRALLGERMATVDPVEGLIASPILEEIALRLFLLSVLAWFVFRVSGRRTVAFVISLVGSALFFAILHLLRPFPGDPALANYYGTALLLKYTLAGLSLGWIFWRWGLPYSILCHMIANGAHLVLQAKVF
jgi:hypothetical protein